MVVSIIYFYNRPARARQIAVTVLLDTLVKYHTMKYVSLYTT